MATHLLGYFMNFKSVTMELKDSRAFSVNQATGRDARFKSTAYKQWYTILKQQIIAHPEYANLLILAEDFLADETQAIELDYHVQYPADFFKNSKGLVSSKTYDVSNTEKLFIDMLVGDIMGINDKYVHKLVSSKGPGDAYALKFTIRLVN